MKILFINSVCGIRSTGRICTDLASSFEKEGHTVKIAYGRESVPEKYQKYAIRVGSDFGVKKNALACRIFDNDGFSAKRATKKFLEFAEEFDPDILWLHNLHGYYINIEALFAWIKTRPDMQVKWTLHDCWAFTGHCPYFTMADCHKWKDGCFSCPQKKRYPKSYIKGGSKENFARKKKAFTDVANLTIYTPSKWLENLVKESFLGDYPTEVLYNKIDTNIFKPTPSDFREKFNLNDKKIVLGVASTWEKRKGLDDFIKLSKMLPPKYKIVLVGLTKKQIKRLPENILCIERTNNQKELAEVYAAADVFVNPTYEDNFPTVNLEAEACGTPVITYNTGGCAETIKNSCSITIGTGNIDEMYKMIINKLE